MSVQDPLSFGTYFINNEFKKIYNAATADFHTLISVEDFIEIGKEYNKGVTHYEIAHQFQYDDITQFLWLDDQKKKAIVVAFDVENVIQSLYLKPYVIFPETDQKFTKNKYRMPIEQEWFVFWGGTNEFVNYHYPYEQQRYAYDLIIMKDGRSYMDSPTLNANYYAFNADVVAPYAGEVITVVSDIKDNVPGEMDEENAAGNYIVIAHPNKEYSMIAHFKKDSIVVKPGDTVKEGQLLGQCGNSGNSSEAHIHFQVMDKADMNEAKSIRIQFQDDFEPIQGDIVKPLPFKDHSEEKFDKVENSFSIVEMIQMIPKVIGQLFK